MHINKKREMNNKPLFLIIAGPNGAGKTTCAMTLLPEELHVRHYVNADLIAKGLSPFDPSSVDFEAGRIMLRRIHELRELGENFAMETTLASRSIAKFVRECKIRNYETRLIFVALPDPETATARVELRVSMGGHDIPKKTIRRRFYRGLKNLFDIYMPIVDRWTILDNSGTEKRVIAESDSQSGKQVYDDGFYRLLEKEARDGN